jgi:hypothetical protein
VDADFAAAKSEIPPQPAGLAIIPELVASDNALAVPIVPTVLKPESELASASIKPVVAVSQVPLLPSLPVADPLVGFGLDGFGEPRSLLSEALDAFAEASPETPKVELISEEKPDSAVQPPEEVAVVAPPSAEATAPSIEAPLQPLVTAPSADVLAAVAPPAITPAAVTPAVDAPTIAEEKTAAEVHPLALLSAAVSETQADPRSAIEREVLKELSASPVPQQVVATKSSAEPLPVEASEAPAVVADASQPVAVKATEEVVLAATPAPEKVSASLPALAAAIAKPPIRQPQVAQMSSADAQSRVQRDQSAVAVLEAAPDHKGAATVFQSSVETQSGPTQLAGSKLAMGGLRNYSQEAASRMKPAVPANKSAAVIQGAVESLPGPALPVELTSLKGAGVSRVATFVKPPAPPPKSSNWMVSFLVAAVLLAGCLGLAFYAMPGLASTLSPTKPEVSDQIVPPAPTPTKEVADVPAHPLQPFVEVTGFRLVTEPGKSPEIHYLVVNHSGAALLNATVTVTLHAADATADQAPISRFSFKVPELGGYRSKDMISPVDKLGKASDMPNWQDLRADVEIAR